jgi:hypothetical protein
MTLGKVFILTGKDNHAYRLIQGLQSINDNVCFGASIDQTKAESNREHLAVLTPGKICQDFLDQLK